MIDAPLRKTVQRTPAMPALVVEHLDLVRRIAAQMLRRLPSSVEFDDLVQSGTVGLMEAAVRYECRNGSTFATFATQRIRGAMIDSLRRSDWGSRSLRRRLRDIADARQRLESRTGSAAKAPAIAASLGMTLKCYFGALQADNQAAQISTDALLGERSVETADGKLGLSETLEQAEMLRAIAAAIDTLTVRDRVILLLYYDREVLMRDIGIQFALSESRICQILKRTIERLRVALRN
jgi:RNA polymerase sigma factor for flagellar operon FliA